jgi:acetate kinase
MFADGIVRYIGSCYAFLGGMDHLVFTGGIGENDHRLRAEVCGRISHLGVALDDRSNREGPPRRVISGADSRVTAHVIPADEELVVARKTHEYGLS